MAVLEKIQGDDIEIELTLKDANGSVVAPSTLVDYHIYLYSYRGPSKKLQLTYKKTPGAGEKQINVVNDPQGIIGIVIPRSWTKTAMPERLFLELKTQGNASASFESSKANDGGHEFIVCDLKPSANPTGVPA